MTADPTVFVVDDDASVLRAISRLLRLEFVVEAYDSPWPFLEALRPDTPGCILLDLALPGVSGLELQERLIASGCCQPIVVLSGQGSVRTSVQAMRAGALDFIEKPWENDTLLETVRRALRRDHEMRARRSTSDSIARRVASLTPRESEVFRHVIAGRLNKQIADDLGISIKTVEAHRANIMEKLNANTVADLLKIALGATTAPAKG